MDILSTAGQVLFTSAATLIKDALIEAVAKRANLRGADLYGADLRGANLYGANGENKKVHSLRSFSSSLYPYMVLAVLFEDGERMVKMGCLEKTLSEWKKVGIRKSNVSEFPDDGSDKCEDRVGLFNLAKAAVTRMTL
jgi:hypothetical protein